MKGILKINDKNEWVVSSDKENVFLLNTAELLIHYKHTLWLKLFGREGLEVEFYISYESGQPVIIFGKEESVSMYCPVCSGCGEEGCCSPMMCQQDPNGSYCLTYLKDLKFAYNVYEKLLQKLESSQEKYQELLDFIDETTDKVYDKIYK